MLLTLLTFLNSQASFASFTAFLRWLLDVLLISRLDWLLSSLYASSALLRASMSGNRISSLAENQGLSLFSRGGNTLLQALMDLVRFGSVIGFPFSRVWIRALNCLLYSSLNLGSSDQ